MANYVTRSDIEVIHGSVNVKKWADLNNDQNTTIINNRINWSAELATEYLNGRLIMGRYPLPFDVDGTPKIITFLAGLFAGILLYDGRLVVAGSERDQVSHKRREFKRWLRQILSGQLKLNHPSTGELIESECETAPVVITDQTYLYVDLVYQQFFIPIGQRSTRWCESCCCHTCVCRSLVLPTY